MNEILIEPKGAFEVWTFNAEARRNALSKALVGDLENHLLRLSKLPQSVRAVVLRGAGPKAFCAGADLKERAAMAADEVPLFLARVRAVFRSLEESRCVFIAFLNGAALGGGFELALCCDLRVMAPAAELGLPEVKLGIIPGAGGTQRLPRLVGPAVAKDLIMTGRRVGADEALRLGLVSRIGGQDDAESLAAEITQNAPIAVGLAKQAIDQGLHLEIDQALSLEQEKYAQTLTTEDRLEGLRAFAEKRPPKYLGR